MPRRLVLLLWLLSLCASFALGSPNLGAEGSYKSIVGFQQLRQTDLFPHQTQGLAEQRLRAQGTLTWDWFAVELAHETSLWLKGANDSRTPLPTAPRTGLRGDWSVFDSSNSALAHRLDRASLQAAFPVWELTVGRQVLPGGVGQFFSAVSQAPRSNYVTVDPEYRIGRDGALFALKTNPRIELAILARGELQRTHDFNLRLKSTLFGYDVAVVGGRSDEKPFAGIEAAGNLGDSILRGELAVYEENRRSYWQGLVGWEKVLGSSWSTRAELFYNGFGRSGPEKPTRATHRFSPYLGSWYAAAGTTWEISPRWRATATVVSNLGDPSAVAHLHLLWSWASDVDLTVGHFLSVSRPATGEFGGKSPLPFAPQYEMGTSDLTYAEIKMSF